MGTSVDDLSQMLHAVKLKDANSWTAPVFERFAAKEYKGFAGVWRFYNPGGTHKDHLDQSFPCIRTYTVTEDNAKVIYRNFHKTNTFGKPRRRSLDGVYQDTYERRLSDEYFTCSMKLSEEELRTGSAPSNFRRMVPIGSSTLVRVAPAIPTRPISGEEYVCSLYAPFNHAQRDSKQASLTWAFEWILTLDPEDRWSVGAIYDLQSLRLRSHFFIQELGTTVDPTQRICLEEQPIREPRERLSSDVQHWMEGGKWQGTMTEIIWDEDGDFVRCPPRRALWTPPQLKSNLYRLYLYPDAFYSYLPFRLPEDAGERRTSFDFRAFKDGVKFEMGGMARSQTEFRRVILRYAMRGELESVTEEVYHLVQ